MPHCCINPARINTWVWGFMKIWFGGGVGLNEWIAISHQGRVAALSQRWLSLDTLNNTLKRFYPSLLARFKEPTIQSLFIFYQLICLPRLLIHSESTEKKQPMEKEVEGGLIHWYYWKARLDKLDGSRWKYPTPPPPLPFVLGLWKHLLKTLLFWCTPFFHHHLPFEFSHLLFLRLQICLKRKKKNLS